MTRHPNCARGARLFALAALLFGGVELASHECLADQSSAATGLDASSLARRISELHRARGAEMYTALRAVWREWDQGDPQLVEEAIGEVERDSLVPPPVRAYAAIIGAYARRRRGDLAGAKAKVRAVGMVGRWLAVGPFDNEGKEGFARAFGPETELSDPVSLLRPYQGKERPVRWRTVPEAYDYGWLDLGDLVRPREKVCAYATTFVRAKPGSAAPRTISIWGGATGAFKLFWNGAEVISDPAYRGLDQGRMAAAVTLAKGWSRLTAKVCGAEESPMLSVRLGDAKGAPDPNLEVTADAAVAPEAAKNSAQQKREPKLAAEVTPKDTSDRANESPEPPAKGTPSPGPPAPIPAAPTPPTLPAAMKPRAGGVEGPLQTLARLAAGKKPPASVLEMYARYLSLTGGDDPADHQAQDFSRRAANDQPTLARALLAAELSDDRNEKREWLVRAEKLVGSGARPIELLLAQAELARTGTNWRDATPFYDGVLRIDPDNLRALLGRVDLYQEAGLKRTALLTLEAATVRNPKAVALLRVYSAALRELGRTTEADEVADRYAALRFDDSTYLGDRIELAVLRNDPKAAARWIDRLLAVDPDSAWALSAAASAYRALGQDARAVAYYQKALEFAPEDIEVLRAQADLFGAKGRRDEQLSLLRQILTYRPQEKDVREYVEHIEPPKPRVDEMHAWAPERFLAQRNVPETGHHQRVLRDLTVTTVFPNGLASRFHQIVFQPLTDEAAAAAREYAFGYQADSETVQLRSAKVYRGGGKIDEAVESGDAPADNPALAMYTSTRTFYVHFPRLNAGDVVELRYRVEDVAARNDFADYFGEIAYLQRTEPSANVEYVLRTPKSRTFSFFASPLPGLTRSEKVEGDQRVYDFKADQVAPITIEPSMPPLPEALAHVHVSTYKTWDQVATWYWGLAKDQLIPDDEVRSRVAEITKGLTEPEAKVRAIYDYVVQRTRYVALELGIYGYKPRPCALTFARGWGDCKDKATLIVTMLKEAGIPANLVLVRTGMRGEIEPEPASLSPFDHAIAYVPSMKLFLDGTAEYTGSAELPTMDRGAVALVVEEGGKGTLTHLPEADAEATTRSRKIDAILGAEGGAQLDIRIDTSGALASDWRQRYHAKGTRKERIARDLSGDFSGFELPQGPGAVEMNNLEDIEEPVKVRVRGKAPSFGRREGPDLSLGIAPMGRIVPAFASLSTRKQDLRLSVRSTLDDELIVHLPPGVRVKSAPEPLSAETPFGAYAIAVETSGNKITVKTRLALRKTRILPGEYAAWRSFCEAADRAFSQRLVLGAGK